MLFKAKRWSQGIYLGIRRDEINKGKFWRRVFRKHKRGMSVVSVRMYHHRHQDVALVLNSHPSFTYLTVPNCRFTLCNSGVCFWMSMKDLSTSQPRFICYQLYRCLSGLNSWSPDYTGYIPSCFLAFFLLVSDTAFPWSWGQSRDYLCCSEFAASYIKRWQNI